MLHWTLRCIRHFHSKNNSLHLVSLFLVKLIEKLSSLSPLSLPNTYTSAHCSVFSSFKICVLDAGPTPILPTLRPISVFILLHLLDHTYDPSLGLPRWCSWKRTHLPMQETYETWVWYLEEGMATHSNIISWRIPWTGEPATIGLQRVRHDWSDCIHKCPLLDTILFTPL